jgi:hypothetical protein
VTERSGGAGEESQPGGARTGRQGGGYGGFFWRLPRPAGNAEMFTPSARGEQGVHGGVAPWVAWSADFTPGPGKNGPATIVIAAAAAAAAGEPWFVRVSDYPGLGSALTWDRPVSLQPGDVLSRRFDIAIADGRLTEAETTDLANKLMTPS